MPYSIALPDGRIVRGIPDDIPPDRAKAMLAQRMPELAQYLRDDTVTDILKEVGAGGAALGQMVTGDIPRLLGAGDNRVGEFFGGLREDIKGTLSPAAQLADLNINAAIEEAGRQGMSAQFIEALKQYATNPGAAIRLMAEQAPQLLVALGAGAGAGAVARLAGAGAKALKTAQVAGAVGSESVLQGGDIGNDAYERLQGVWKKTPEYFRAMPEFVELVAQGASEDEAADRIALSQARGAALTSGAIVAGLGFGPGGTIYRSLFRGGKEAAEAALPKTTKQALLQIGKVTAAEVGSEGLEEGPFGQGVANIAVRDVDPTQDLGENVGAATAQGMVAALGPGAVAGTYSGMRDLGTYRAIEARKAAEAQAEEARKAALRGVGGDEPGSQLGFQGFDVPDKEARKKAGQVPAGWLAQEGIFGEDEAAGISEKDASAKRKAVYKAVEQRNRVPAKPEDLTADSTFRSGLLSPEPAHWAFQTPDDTQPLSERVDSNRLGELTRARNDILRNYRQLSDEEKRTAQKNLPPELLGEYNTLLANATPRSSLSYAERVDAGLETPMSLEEQRRRFEGVQADKRAAALPPMPQITEQMGLQERRLPTDPLPAEELDPSVLQPVGVREMPPPRQPKGRERNLRLDFSAPPAPEAARVPSAPYPRVQPRLPGIETPGQFEYRQRRVQGVTPGAVPATPAAVQGTTIAPAPPVPAATAVPPTPASVAPVAQPAGPARIATIPEGFAADAQAYAEIGREELENFLFDAWVTRQERGQEIPRYMQDAFEQYDYDPATDNTRLSGYEGGEAVPKPGTPVPSNRIGYVVPETNVVPVQPSEKPKGKAALTDENRVIPKRVNDLAKAMGVTTAAVLDQRPQGRLVTMLADPEIDRDTKEDLLFETWADQVDNKGNRKKATYKYLDKALEIFEYKPWEDADRLQRWEARNGRVIGQPKRAHILTTESQESTDIKRAEGEVDILEEENKDQRARALYYQDLQLYEEGVEEGRLSDEDKKQAEEDWETKRKLDTRKYGKSNLPEFAGLSREAKLLWYTWTQEGKATATDAEKLVKYNRNIMRDRNKPYLAQARVEIGDVDQGRRSFVIGTAAVLASAPTDANGKLVLGKAKPISEEVIEAKLPKEIAEILDTKNKTSTKGLKRIHEALDMVIKSGDAQLRPLASKIKGILPTSGDVWLTVDHTSMLNVNGMVEFSPVPHLYLFTAGNRTGLTYETFLHEVGHLAILAKYRNLSSILPRGNDKLLGLAPPNAVPELLQFEKIWREFRSHLQTDNDVFSKYKDNLHVMTAIRQARANPDEFFIRALTDPYFQAYLSGVEYNGKTLWERFKDWVKYALFGFVRSEGTIPSWLDAALIASDDLIDASKKDPSDWTRLKSIRDYTSSKTPKQVNYQVIEDTFSPTTADELIGRYAPTTPNKIRDLKNQIKSAFRGKPVEVGNKKGYATPSWIVGLADMRAPIRDKMRIAQKAFFDPAKSEVRADLHLDIADKSITAIAQAALEYGPVDLDQYGLAYVPMDGSERASYRRILDRLSALEKEQGIKMHRAVGMLNAALIGKRAAAIGANDAETGRRIRKMGVPENEQRLADEIWDANPWIAEVYGMMREHLNGQIDFLVKAGKIPQAKANEWKQATYYVPFYRVFEKVEVEPKQGKVAGLNSPMEVVRELTGSDREIGDVLTGMMRQSMFMTAAGVKSNAVRATAKQLIDLGLAKYISPKSGKGVRNYDAKFFNTNGKEVGVRFNNREDAQAISYIEQEFGPLMKYLQKATGMLRSGIIRMPDYMVRDLYRNLQQSYAMAGDQNAAFLKTMFRGTQLAARNLQRNLAGGLKHRHNKPMSPAEQFMKSHGIAGGWELMGDMKELDKLAGHYGPMIGKTTRFWRKLMDINMDTDLAAKEQLFESLTKQGVHEVEAMYRAYSIAPFSQRGRNGLVRTVSSMMPFVQANIKGLHMLYQFIQGDVYSMPIEQRQAARRMFINRGIQLAVFTAVYTMMMSDDDLYESQNDTVRDMNFMIPLSDKLALRLPIAPEVGLLFKIPVERATRALMGNKHAFDNIGDTVTNFVPFWGVLPTEGGGGPQLIRPWVEVATNYSFFQNRPIVPEALKRLPEEEQFTAYTSAFARNLAPLLGGLPGIPESPMKLDYLMRGIFGTAGTFALFLGDSLAKPFGVESAPTAVTRMPGLTQGLFANDMGSRQSTLFYELKAEADRAAGAYNKMVKEGRIDDAMRYYDEKAALMSVKKYLNKISDVAAKLRERQRMILRDKNLSREEKLRMSEEITRAINDLLMQSRMTAELTGVE